MTTSRRRFLAAAAALPAAPSVLARTAATDWDETFDVVVVGSGVAGTVAAIAAADLLIVGGTSLTVYPAAGLIDAYAGHRLALVNKTATGRDARADLVLREPIAALFARL